ncbi:MAG: 4a-hydroxytetrahydrobiopterin dehydratase [Polyangiaceae bacterium]
MSPTQCSDAEIDKFLDECPGHARSNGALERTYTFGSYGAGVAFAVSVAMAAEKRDHHPDLLIGWRRVVARWSTHDAGGISSLDLEMARATDALYTP